jgi:hypothetical protein
MTCIIFLSVINLRDKGDVRDASDVKGGWLSIQAEQMRMLKAD